jgi:DNA gyrase subunit B
MQEENIIKNSYNEESIEELSQIEGARFRPQSIGFESHSHIFTEQLANAIDEAREGFGKVIEVIKYDDDSISVRDYGRSIPLDYNPKTQKYNWKTIFLTMWGGGKYSNNKDKANYKKSLGTNGAGNFGSATTSQFFEVWSYKGNECQNIRFEEGKIAKEFNKYNDNIIKGTKTHFKPDIKCYGENIIDDDFIETMVQKQSIINGGIKFIYINNKNNSTKEYYYENGILDYIKEINQNKEFTPIYKFKGECFIPSNPEDFEADYEIYFTFNNSINLTEYYHNSSYLPNGGLPEKVIKSAMTDIFDKYIKTNNLYKKGEKIKFDDISDSLIIIFSSGSTTSIFSDQTKKSIDHKDLQKNITDEFKNYLEVLLIENKMDTDKICNQLLINMRARIKANNTKNEEKKKNQNQLTRKPVGKLTDCTSNNPEECEIFLTEGDSAGGNAKQCRNRKTQAILPQRGKSENVEKTSNKKSNKGVSQDLKNIENSLGCSVGKNFDKNKLRYFKIICLADADFDGAGHIVPLWLTYFYRNMKQLLLDGHIYIAVPPLYKNVIEIKNKEEIIKYTYSEEEQIEFLSHTKPIGIQRYKGLGEMNSNQLWETTMNPETRRLIQVVINNDDETDSTFKLLMGDEVTPRYEFIMQNAKFARK